MPLQLETSKCKSIEAGDLAGLHELVFSSAISKIPLVRGYMVSRSLIKSRGEGHADGLMLK